MRRDGVPGCIANGIPEEKTANKIYDEMIELCRSTHSTNPMRRPMRMCHYPDSMPEMLSSGGVHGIFAYLR